MLGASVESPLGEGKKEVRMPVDSSNAHVDSMPKPEVAARPDTHPGNPH
jgi:hypothetical protein